MRRLRCLLGGARCTGPGRPRRTGARQHDTAPDRQGKTSDTNETREDDEVANREATDDGAYLEEPPTGACHQSTDLSDIPIARGRAQQRWHVPSARGVGRDPCDRKQTSTRSKRTIPPCPQGVLNGGGMKDDVSRGGHREVTRRKPVLVRTDSAPSSPLAPRSNAHREFAPAMASYGERSRPPCRFPRI